MDELGRIMGWLHDVAEARSERAVNVPGGRAYLHSGYPVAHSQNFLRLTTDEEWVDAEGVDQVARAVLGGAGVDHRVVEVYDDALADRLDAGLKALGYQRANDLILIWRGGTPAAVENVVELGLEERADVAARWRMNDNPSWPEEIARQLGDRVRTIAPAVDCTWLAIRDENTIVSRADLFRSNGIAQVEEVGTVPEARGRGFASSLVLEGVRRAQPDLTFIIADADDWPAQLYRRLGFEDLGRTALFVNSPYE